jgi:pimeloyl-ACP methyl ester carboxylesterase
MNLNVEISGKGYPILCLHGHPGSSSSMSVFTEFLSSRYQTIAPDLRGYGKSQSREDFQMEDHLTDLQALLDRQQIDRCLLLGWSLGGILALELAIAEPQRFSGLILIASAARPLSNHPPITKLDLCYSAIAGIVNYLQPGWQWNIDTFGKKSLFRYLFTQQIPSAYRYLASEGVPAYFRTSPQANRALWQALSRGYNRLDALDVLEMPCLVLAGANDRHITAAASQETAEKLKFCQYYNYPQTAHLFPWEIPQQVVGDIDRWLRNNIEE